MNEFLYTIGQITWGLPQTIAGFAVYEIMKRRGCRHFTHHGARVTVWNVNAGLSLGMFIFVDARANGINDRLLVHEYGHTVQSLILGPLYLPVIGLPSVIWLKAPALSRSRRARGVSYYSFYTERWANRLGELVLGRPSMGFALID